VLRLTRRGVLRPNTDGGYPARSSVLAYVRHWVDVHKAVRKLLDEAPEPTITVSADFLAERLMLDKDEVWNYATAGVLPCHDKGQFPLLATLLGFMEICAQRMAGVDVPEDPAKPAD
jgi:hypothetical protein